MPDLLTLIRSEGRLHPSHWNFSSDLLSQGLPRMMHLFPHPLHQAQYWVFMGN